MKTKMKIYLAGDHAGFKLKEKIKKYLKKHHQIEDFGPLSYIKDDDYPDYTIPLAEAVSKNKQSLGIVIAGSGIGECIAANKVKGTRAVMINEYNKLTTISKAHDNTNILCLGSWFLKEKEAKKIISLWIKTKFSEETRHKRRLNKISKYENRR